MDNIKIIRLEDGEDIITSFEIDDETDTIIMNNPMCLFFKRISSGKSFVMMSPWIPAELVKRNIAKIHARRIISIFDPKASLIEYYISAVNDCNDMIKLNEDLIDQSLVYNNSEDEEEESEDTSEVEPVEHLKTRTLH